MLSTLIWCSWLVSSHLYLYYFPFKFSILFIIAKEINALKILLLSNLVILFVTVIYVATYLPIFWQLSAVQLGNNNNLIIPHHLDIKVFERITSLSLYFGLIASWVSLPKVEMTCKP